MATVTISTTAEEQEAVLRAVKATEDATVSLAKIAEEASLSLSRTRYAMADLVEAGKVQKIPVKKINKHYVRYKYKTV